MISTSIITTLITATIIGAFGAFILLKIMETRMNTMLKDIEELKTDNKNQENKIIQLETKHELAISHIQGYIQESKEEAKGVRKALTDNTIAINSLESFLKRIESKL